MRIVVSGIIGQYPLAGVTLSYLQYVLGLRKLGHEVYYLEDNTAWPYNPMTHSVEADCSYSLRYLQQVMRSFDLSERWAYADHNLEYFGMSKQAVHEILRTADLYVNLSGATVLREEHMACPVRVYVNTDPAFAQFEVALGLRDQIEELANHTLHFTFAENIGKAKCTIPTDRFSWQTTRQPAYLAAWTPCFDCSGTRFTTVTNWSAYEPIVFRNELYGQKDVEFLRFLTLPQRTNQEIELAIAVDDGPKELLIKHGWRVVDPRPCTKDIPTFQNYIASSRAEFSLAKNAYVKTWSGETSERDINYLAAGRPVLAQDTGFSDFLPTGHGLLAFQTMEDILAGIEEINGNYTEHCKAARRMAEEYFDSDLVLREFLCKCGA
jgi:hypothetical protein